MKMIILLLLIIPTKICNSENDKTELITQNMRDFIKIAKVESNFNPFVIGKDGDAGIVQIRKIVLKDLKIKDDWKRFDIFESFRIFELYCQKYKATTLEEKAALWNAGPGWRLKIHLNKNLKKYITLVCKNEQKSNYQVMKFKNDKERQLQINCVAWFKLQYPDIIIHHSPNGGYRNIIAATLFKKMGVSAGFPDLFIARANKKYNGLFIELKSDTGRLNENQRIMTERLKKEGYHVEIVRSFDNFVKVLNDYLNNRL